MLFRFSALTYNAHRIHYDHEWCRQEGYGDRVVHGPPKALIMSELVCRNGAPLVGRCFGYELVPPMIGAQTMRVLAAADWLKAVPRCARWAAGRPPSPSWPTGRG